MEILVCPNCLALNHIAREQISEEPESVQCAECQARLLPDTPIDAETALFKRFIAHSSLPVVVDFWGSWSGTSREMAQVFVNLNESFKGDALFLKVNSESEQVLSAELNLAAIPTFILFKEGKEYHRLTGYHLQARFHEWLARYLRVKRPMA